MTSSSSLLQSHIEEDDYEMMYKKIIETIEQKHNILLHGPGGTGKTYMIAHRIASYMKNNNRIIHYTATTGVAAIGINNPSLEVSASTFHRWAGIGLATQSSNYLVSKIRHNPKALARWNTAEVLVIDEFGMMGKELFDKLDAVARRVRIKDGVQRLFEPFGGLQVIMSGDVLQLPPVKDTWIFKSDAFLEMKFVPFVFKTPKRYPDVNFFEMLLRIRVGKQTAEDIHIIRSRVAAYRKLNESLDKAKTLNVIRPTIIYSKKVDVECYNISELQKLPGYEVEIHAVDDYHILNDRVKHEDYQVKLEDAAPKSLKLKIGAQVMLKTNLDVGGGLVNGSRGVVLDISEPSDKQASKVTEGYIVKVRFLNGKIIDVVSKGWDIEDMNGKATRSQMPLILAWALTIHKVQGGTLDYAVVDLGDSIFEDGQAYVGLSRIRELKGLFISSFREKSIKVNLEALEFSKYLETYKYQ